MSSIFIPGQNNKPGQFINVPSNGGAVYIPPTLVPGQLHQSGQFVNFPSNQSNRKN